AAGGGDRWLLMAVRDISGTRIRWLGMLSRVRLANAKLLTADCEDRRDDVHRMDAGRWRRAYLSLNDRQQAEGLFLTGAQVHAPIPLQVIFGPMDGPV